MIDLNSKKRLVAFFVFVGFCSLCLGQSSVPWSKFEWLMGEWIGEGAGQPGQGNGSFTFNLDLDKKILVRKSHTRFPKTENKQEIKHDDLMVISLDYSGNPSTAIYFDSEGHTISYAVFCSENAIVFTSSKTMNAPVFRLTYTLLDNGLINTKFEMSPDGEKFNTYIEGKSKRIR